MLRDCIPNKKSMGASDDTVPVAHGKVHRLCDYAVQYPQQIALIGEDVGASLQQHYRAKQYGLVDAYTGILKALVAKCAEGQVLALLQPYVVNALMLLLRSTHVRVASTAAALFFEYTDRLNEKGSGSGGGDNHLAVFLAPILDLCDRSDAVIYAEHQALADDNVVKPLLLGHQMLQRVIAAMVAAPGAALLESHLPKVRC